MQSQGRTVGTTARQVVDLVQEVEGRSQTALQARSAETDWISSTLETWVEELVLKHYARKGSRVLSKEDLRGWAAKIRKAGTACDQARMMQVATEAGALSL